SEKKLLEGTDCSEHQETKQNQELNRSASIEQMETVLNQGMDFLNSLSMMATGKSLTKENNNKSVEIDRKTGEVVMRFKLPGFGG
ncbi:MAG: hypothetical protein KAR21_07745, partial [Spirochaetales bacterium]|nr:hypothetical protein [Spirochaetales bacterium]